MAEIIVRDILDTVLYLKYALAVSFMLTVILLIWKCFHVKSINVLDTIKCMAFLVYLAMLVQIALLSREPGSRTTIMNP